MGLCRDVLSVISGPGRRDFLDGQPRDLILRGLLARLVGPLDDEPEALGVVEQAGIEFRLDGAAGRRAREAGQADFLGNTRMELEHGE